MTNEHPELTALREGLRKSAPELPITELFPLFVPRSFFASGKWPGPYELLRLPGLGLTWAISQPQQTMRYVDRGIQQYWESQGIRWRERALMNMQMWSGEKLWTHEILGDNGRISSVAMMHSDGIGPSRLLFRDKLEALFPEGYLIALPEMSCGLALSATASATERRNFEEMVQRCFTKGTRPLVPGIHNPSLLTCLPSE